MSQLDRRQSLKLFLGGLLSTAGTVVLASTVLPVKARQSETQEASAESEDKTQQDSQKDLAQRADRVAEAQGSRPNGDGQEPCSFLNSFGNSFKNGGGGGGGAFKNGGFANGGGGGAFRNGAFANGAFRNGG
jgi:rSAM-associated Gly-rich repeat protein